MPQFEWTDKLRHITAPTRHVARKLRHVHRFAVAQPVEIHTCIQQNPKKSKQAKHSDAKQLYTGANVDRPDHVLDAFEQRTAFLHVARWWRFVQGQWHKREA